MHDEDAGEVAWKSGLVVEDSEGVRWRADIGMSTGRRRWRQRVRTPHIWLDGPELEARGPLRIIRQDKFIAGGGPGSLSAGEAEDLEHARQTPSTTV